MLIETTTPAPPQADRNAAIRKVAAELEGLFLDEMLKHAGFGEARESFGGGVGEAQFADMMRREQARHIANAGGIGLAEQLFQQIAGRSNE
ncbi:rod-binding protein [Roseicyclus sp. F158]|uniref:Rod-binding protein n=1 Tax=Tropicimonas omnivorans TaxID=3075590 RepID=A0ABU3DDA4_9RHOB|nr:rod-binding protein [Roseicyclus sp. F158]MDT0681700.1 rod-binding protein [Roseicyclus sp. F158]